MTPTPETLSARLRRRIRRSESSDYLSESDVDDVEALELRLEEVGRLVEVYVNDVGSNEGVYFDDHDSLPRIRAIIAGEEKP